ncbi:hypothetical protein GCM10009111_07120 [Colwellia asteriadis]|uniref:Heme biosynthesis operon protein HemX n=1 Tax=Colwellia asteriadis TaxID=517723 RepID=A0ABP3WD14_9GAMM
MLDKDKPTQSKASDSATDKKTLVVENKTNTAQSSTSPEKNQSKQRTTAKTKTADKKPAASTVQPSRSAVTPKQKISKLAIFALLIALLSIAASVGHYFWQEQQSSLHATNQNAQTTQALQDHKQQLESSLGTALSQQLQTQLQKQQQEFSRQLQQYNQQNQAANQAELAQFNDKITRLEKSLKQRDPSDWLIHESEYLIRVAARTMWLEQDTRAAISLLKEADSRLEELKQPKFLPIRSLIRQDIEALALMPTLDTQNAILHLMALNKQVASLPLAKVNVPQANDAFTKQDLELSNDISDWQSNLGKTWQRFFNDFIVVRRRTGNIEPLMAPGQQQNLKQNLSLKIQLAQWSASEHKPEIYKQTLLDIQEWLKQFFDMTSTVNQNFYSAVEAAKKHVIDYNYPSHLDSLTAIKQLLNESAVAPEPEQVEPEAIKADAANDEGTL